MRINRVPPQRGAVYYLYNDILQGAIMKSVNVEEYLKHEFTRK
jgi:hypothetical protein